MKGKGERGGIFSSVFGNLLQRRGENFPKLLLTGSSGVLQNERCYFHRCRGSDICPTGRAAAAAMGVFYAPPCVKRRGVVNVWLLRARAREEDPTVLEHKKNGILQRLN